MEQKNKAWIVTGIVSLVVIVLIILFTVMAVTSTSPKQTIEGLLTNLKAGEFEKAQEFVTGEKELLESAKDFSTEIQKSLFDKLSWKITNITQEGEKATIELEISNKDLKTIARDVIKDSVVSGNMSKEELEKALEDALKSEEVATTTNAATLQAIKEENKWKVELDEELKTAILPALQDVVNAIKAIDVVNNLNK